MKNIKKGDTVTFKPEYSDAGDTGHVFKAIENEDGGRVKVECTTALKNYNPVQVVSTSMIKGL